MVPRVLLDTAPVPGGGELRLIQRGDEYSIVLGANALMNSRMSGSEEALATLALERIDDTDAPAVLIGGLGMGFTLRAALPVLGPKARVVVSELMPAIVTWARGPMAHLHAGSLDDPRVSIVEGDVADILSSASGAWDAILLDVDNGPEGLTRAGNDHLYSDAGLAAARAALRSRGVLAVWSAAPDPAFTRRLGRARFVVEEHEVRARGTRGGPRHLIWLARRRG